MKKDDSIYIFNIDDKLPKQLQDSLPNSLFRGKSLEIHYNNDIIIPKNDDEDKVVDAMECLDKQKISSFVENDLKCKENYNRKKQELISFMTPSRHVVKYKLFEKFLYRPFYFFLLIVNFTSLGLSIHIFLTYYNTYTSDISSMTGVINMIASSLGENPIINVQLINSTINQCPNGYSQETLTQWNGLSPGCWCQNENKIYRGKCNILEKVSCQTLDGLSGLDFTIWNQFKICVKRVSQFTLELNTCQTNFKKCGNYICIPVSEDCPLTIQNLTQVFPNYSNQTQIPSSSELMGSNSYPSPLIHLNIGRSQLCLNINAILPRDNGLSYPLELQPIQNCGEYSIYQETSIVDKELEILAYQQNLANNSSNWINSYPEFNSIIQNQNLTLIAKFQPLLTNLQNCLSVKNGDYQRAIDQIYFRMVSYSLIAYLSLIGTSAGSIISISILIFLIKFKWRKFDDNIIIRNTIFFCIVFILVLFILLNVQNFIISSSNDQNFGNFPEIEESACFQNININLALKNFWNYSESITNGFHSTMILIWMILYFICFLMGLIFQTSKYFIKLYANSKLKSNLSRVNQA